MRVACAVSSTTQHNDNDGEADHDDGEADDDDGAPDHHDDRGAHDDDHHDRGTGHHCRTVTSAGCGRLRPARRTHHSVKN